VSDDTIRSQKRRKAIIAGAAGVALLLGGSTYALWTDSANLAGGQITAGDLSISAGDFAAYDISSDRIDSVTGPEIVAGTGIKGHTITLTADGAEVADSDWRIVPGDQAALVYPYTITLVGDNLLANLKLNVGELLAGNANADMTFDYAIYESATGDAIIGKSALPASDATPLATFASRDADVGGGVADSDVDAVVGSDDTLDVTVVLFATFAQSGYVDVDEATSYVKALTDLSGNMIATLDQVRSVGVSGGGQYVGGPT